MKRVIGFILILIGINFGFSQFTISGEVDNYNNEYIFIYEKGVVDNDFIAKIQTDNKGKFSYTFQNKFEGILSLLFEKESLMKELISDNSNINFKANIEDRTLNFITIDNKSNELLIKYQETETNLEKLSYLEELIKLYKNNSLFKTKLQDEINLLKKTNIPVIEENSFIKYYIDIKKLVELEILNESDTKNLKDNLAYKIINDGENLEKSGYLYSLILNYFNTSVVGSKNLKEQQDIVKTALDYLLAETDIESSRGQNIVLAATKVFSTYPKYFSKLHTEYLGKVSELKCKISPELEKAIKINNNLGIGKEFPEITFSEVKNGKYKTINEIPATYKLIIVWASWCGHCNEEKPGLIEYYPEFKNLGGEFISLSVESNKEEYLKFHNGINWIHDSDLLYWSSKNLEILNITGTPTIFLLNKDNVLLETFSKISKLKEFLAKK